MAGNIIGRTIENVGRAFNLPEMYISERVNSLTPTKNTFGQSNYQDYVVPINAPQRDPGVNTVPSGLQITKNGIVASPYSPALSSDKVSAPNPTTTNNSSPRPSGGNIGGQQNVDYYINEFGNRVAIDNNPQPQQPDLYNEIGGVFDEILGGLGGQQSDLESRIRASADTQRTGINEQLGYGIQNLDTQRDTVRSNQATTLADLAQNMRDNARNIGNYLGSRGSGNSSANDAASFALQKMFGKERAGVQRQANQQLSDIDMAENNLRASTSEMLNNVETWYNSQIADIANQFNSLRNNIGMMKGNLRAQAIETLYNRANEIQNMRTQYAQAIQQSAMQRLQSLNDYKLQLSQSSQFDPAQLIAQEYGFNPMQSYQPENYDMFNPLALARRKDEKNNTML